MKWYPRACPACSGDLHDDLQDRGWVTCMMCARSYQAIDVLAVQRLDRSDAAALELSEAA
jgi:hypothetical protein